MRRRSTSPRAMPAGRSIPEAGKRRHRKGRLFKQPTKHDPLHLVPAHPADEDGIVKLRYEPDQLRHREGFALTDSGTDLVSGGLDEIHYCIFCHHQGKDSCSKESHRQEDRRFRQECAGRGGDRLSARRTHLRDARSQGAGTCRRGAGISIIDNPMVSNT